MKNDQSHYFIKGKIAELIFEMMFREAGKFTVLRFGYEYTLPQIAQHQNLVEVKKVLENIRNAPDFILVSDDRKEVHIVEVKFRSKRDLLEILDIATKNLKTWDPSWLFIASPDGFYFDPCNKIVKNNGLISPLHTTWISENLLRKYQELLNDFEK